MTSRFKDHLRSALSDIRDTGLYKDERIIVSPQDRCITLQDGQEVLNLCANNYLGLSNHPELITAAKAALDKRGYGMSSVRFICGTQDLHRALERKISTFFRTDDTILYAACFDANGGLFDPLLGEEDAIISDALNHASIIDGVRLCKAARFVYRNGDMADLEEKLIRTQDRRFRIIATDGVFSMDGNLAPVDEILALADRFDAQVMVDESHSAGVVGQCGRGVTELFGIMGRIDIITGTLGKAFGGAIGGFTTGRREIIDLLRQRSRPYLFSNSLPPMVVGAAIRTFEILGECTDLPDKLRRNTLLFIEKMKAAGFEIKPTQSAICVVMIYDARRAQDMAERLLEEGIYVIGFSYPVVPEGQARIRVQLSAAHETEDLERAVEAFVRVGRDQGVLSA